MIQILTRSGLIISGHVHTPETASLLQQSAEFMGGQAVHECIEPGDDVVLNIMDGQHIGTVLCHPDGREFRLLPGGWVVFDEHGKAVARTFLPPYEEINRCVMPGGWTWNRP